MNNNLEVNFIKYYIMAITALAIGTGAFIVIDIGIVF